MASELLKNQLHSKLVKYNITDDGKVAKIKKILECAIEKAENSPKCSPDEIWKEFDIVWDKISSQN